MKNATKPPPPFTLMSAVQPKKTRWLWRNRIPLGEITLIDGDPGTNKSGLTDDLAARVSVGQRMPDGTSGVRGGVLLLIGEDSVAKTVRLRLEAAGGNLDRIAVLHDGVMIPDGLNDIEIAARRLRAKLLIIDPLTAFLGRNSNSDQAVRQALAPLKALAERLNLATVLVRHLAKARVQESLRSGIGSIGIVASARSALLLGKDPRDDNLRVLAHFKNNLGPLAPSLRFEPVTAENGAVRVEWRGESQFSANDLLLAKTMKSSQLERAATFLTKVLADGPVEQGVIKARAASEGIAFRTIERAKEMLVRSRRTGFGPGGKFVWSLLPPPTAKCGGQ